jgi:hypothetical protein
MERNVGRFIHLFWFLVLAVLHCVVDVAQYGFKGIGVRKIQRQEGYQRMVFNLGDSVSFSTLSSYMMTYQLHDCLVERVKPRILLVRCSTSRSSEQHGIRFQVSCHVPTPT